MHDIAIRNGRIIDGSGSPEFHGDIGIEGDKIVAVGSDVGSARREIDASGKLVAPGWIDIHTHFDAQVSWDPYLTPSCWNGVTTVVMGNCGVGFAPVRPQDRDWLMDLMDAVEDIPAIAMAAGMEWAWESFPEYLDAIGRKPHSMDVVTQIPHCALRVYVMGERGADDVQPTDEELARMAALVQEGIEAGALGVSSNRLLAHRTKHGEVIPGSFARYPELEAIAGGISAAGGGVFQFVGPFEREWLLEIAKTPGVSVTYLTSEAGQENLAFFDQHCTDYIRIFPQVRGRATTILMNLEGSLHPYVLNYAYRELVGDLGMPERLAKMRDPEVRARILASDWDLTNDIRARSDFDNDHPFLADSTPGSLLPGLLDLMHSQPEHVYVLGDPPNYEPDEDASVAAHARRHGLSDVEAFYDLMTQGTGDTLLLYYLEGYTQRNFDYVHEMMSNPRTRNGLSDAGAHVGAVSDAHMPTWNLTYWGRDRSRGAKLDLETIVHKQTGANADLYGLRDRGLLKPGLRADVNVIDFERLSPGPPPRVVYDLPEHAKRYMQRPQGYASTICGGEIVLEADELTGALPGKLVRGPQTA